MSDHRQPSIAGCVLNATQTSDKAVHCSRHYVEHRFEDLDVTVATFQAVRQSHPPQYLDVVVDLKLMIKVEHVRSPVTHTHTHLIIIIINYYNYDRVTGVTL